MGRGYSLIIATMNTLMLQYRRQGPRASSYPT
jgi:hypothetical protein